MESASSAIETRMSSSSQGRIDQTSESMTSYQSAIGSGIAGGTESNIQSETAKITLGTDAGKPVFIKTIEGCNVERKYDIVYLRYSFHRIYNEYVESYLVTLKSGKRDAIYFYEFFEM